MTRSQIKAELRRSAGQRMPFWDLHIAAYNVAIQFRGGNESLLNLSHSDCGTFFLLVAEAL